MSWADTKKSCNRAVVVALTYASYALHFADCRISLWAVPALFWHLWWLGEQCQGSSWKRNEFKMTCPLNMSVLQDRGPTQILLRLVHLPFEWRENMTVDLMEELVPLGLICKNSLGAAINLNTNWLTNVCFFLPFFIAKVDVPTHPIGGGNGHCSDTVSPTHKLCIMETCTLDRNNSYAHIYIYDDQNPRRGVLYKRMNGVCCCKFVVRFAWEAQESARAGARYINSVVLFCISKHLLL